MTAYEIYLLAGGLFGSLAIISIISAILGEGSPRSTAIMVLIAASCLFMAKRNTDGVVSIDDIPPAINKLIGVISG